MFDSRLTQTLFSFFPKSGMKSIKASLKKIVGLKVSEPLCKLWLRAFTAKLPNGYPSVPRGSALDIHLKEFNIEGVSETSIYAQSSAIESNAAGVLPTILHFDQSISPHYFTFCRELMKEESISKNSIANDVILHLIRLLVVFDYHLRNEWSRILEGRDSNVFPLSFLSEYIDVLRVLFSLSTSESCDFLLVVRSTLSFLEEQFSIVIARPADSVASKFVRQILTFAVSVFSSVSIIDNIHYPLVRYFATFVALSAACDKLPDDVDVQSFVLSLNSKMKAPELTTSEAGRAVIRMIGELLVLHSKRNVECLATTSVLVQTLSQMAVVGFSSDDSMALAKSVVSLLMALFKLYFPKNITMAHPKNDVQLPIESYKNENFDFIEEEFMNGAGDAVLEEEEIKIPGVPSIFKGNQSIVSFFEKLSVLVRTCREFSVCLIRCSIEMLGNSTISHYFTLSVLLLSDPTSVSKILHEKDIWTRLLNASAFELIEELENKQEMTEMIDALIWMCYTSDFDNHSSLMEPLGFFLNSPFPMHIMKTTIRLLNHNEGKFITSIKETGFLDKIIDLDRRILGVLLKDQKREDIISLRSLVFLFMIKLSSNPDGCEQLLRTKMRRHHIFNLLFEVAQQDMAICVIGRGLSIDSLINSVIEDMNYVLCASLRQSGDQRWCVLVMKLLTLLEKNRSERIGRAVIDTSTILTLNKILGAVNFEMAMRIFEFLTSLCSVSPDFVNEMGNSQWQFCETWTHIISQNKLDENIVSALKRMIFLDDSTRLIRSPQALELLMAVVHGTPFEDDVIRMIAENVRGSPMNLYQCSCAGVVGSLLSIVSENPHDSVFELLKLVGSAFFTRNDLGMFLTALVKPDSKATIKLSEIFADIVRASPAVTIPSFFYVDNQNLFTVDNFLFRSKHSISLMLYLEQKSTDGEFIRIYNDKQRITVKFENRCLVVVSGHGQEFKIGSPFELNRWYSLKFDFYRKKIDVFRDQVILATCNQTKSFCFSPKNVSMRIGNIGCLIERVTIHVKSSIEAIYTAQVMKNHICPNTLPFKSTYGDVTFKGFSVKSTTRVVDVISICGGPRVLLPVFASMNNCSEPRRFLFNLLQAVLSIAQTTQLLVKQSFFRCLSQILFSSSAVDKVIGRTLYQIYHEITDVETKGEILVHVFCKWDMFGSDIRHFMISTILGQLFVNDTDLFRSFSSVKWLILSFYEYASESREVLEAFWHLVEQLANIALTEEDADCLLSCLTDCSHLNWFTGLLNVVYSLLERNEVLHSVIQQRHVYDPFFPILASENEEIQMKGLMILYYLQNRFTNSSLSERILHGLAQYHLSNVTFKTMNLLFAFTFGFIPSGSGFGPMEHIEGVTVPNPIQHSEYIPIICYVLHTMKYAKEMITVLRRSILISEESMKQVIKCHDWPFWVLFLSNFGDDWLEWVGVLANLTHVAITQANSMSMLDLEAYIRLCSIIFGQSYELALDKLHVVLSQFENVMKALTPAVVRYVFFLPQPCDALQVPKEKRCNLLSLANHVIELAEPSMTTFKFVPSHVSDNEKRTSFKLKLLHTLVTNLFEKLSDTSYKSLPIVKEHVSVHAIMILCIHDLFVEKRPEAYPILDQYTRSSNFKSGRKYLQVLIDDLKSEPSSLAKLTAVTADLDDPVDVIAMFTEEATAYTKLLDETTRTNLVELKSFLGAIFETPANLSQLRESADECRSSIERQIRQDKFFWECVDSELQKFSGIWSHADANYHWKLEKKLDGIGRRIKMKINDHFNDHKDAALTSDGSQTPSTESVERNIVSIDVDEPLGDREVVMKIPCQLMTVSRYYKGMIYFTRTSIIFEASEIADPFSDENQKAQKLVEIENKAIALVLHRRYLHKDTAAEVFTKSHRSHLFVFTPRERKEFISKLSRLDVGIVQVKASRKVFRSLGYQKLWMQGKMSNYEYLYWLNMFSGRSFNDVAQYPVFPWILSNYKSQDIDLSDESNYRDLSKPIGALNPTRLAKLEELYEDIKDTPTACLYRFHYSTPAYVIHYLLRCEPFTSLHIKLQSGKFDHSSRLFKSIPASWDSVVGTNPDFRELIPEFYSIPDFLMNTENYPLGDDVNDVQLPPWSHNPTEFICINRNALESDIVSKNLHHWIDLVFGCKQQSYEARNLFHPYSESRSIHEAEDQSIIEHYAANFGVIPEMLFKDPHPQRAFHPTSFHFDNLALLDFHVCLNLENVVKLWNDDTNIFTLDSSGRVMKVSLDTFQAKQFCRVKLDFPETLATASVIESRSSVISNSYFAIANPWYEGFQVLSLKEAANNAVIYKREKEARILTCLAGGPGFIVTGGEDSSLTVWDLSLGIIVTSISAHLHPIMTVAFSACLDLIVSVDVSGLVVYSSTDGQSGRRMKKPYVKRVFVGECGVVVTASESRTLNDVTTVFEAYDMSQRLLNNCRIPGRLDAACICTLGDRSEYLCACMSTKKVYVMRIYDLQRVCCGEVTSGVVCCTFSSQANALILCLDTGDLVKHQF